LKAFAGKAAVIVDTFFCAVDTIVSLIVAFVDIHASSVGLIVPDRTCASITRHGVCTSSSAADPCSTLVYVLAFIVVVAFFTCSAVASKGSDVVEAGFSDITIVGSKITFIVVDAIKVVTRGVACRTDNGATGASSESIAIVSVITDAVVS
jgi:hypothetical protein